jgi:hypothetical protein
MSEPTSIKSQVFIPGKGNGKLQRLLTLETVCSWIKLQGFDEYTTNGLIELASKYPTQALPSFRKNFNLMIERVRAKRRQESNLREEQEQANGSKEISKSEIQRPEAPRGDLVGEYSDNFDGQ